MSREALRTQVEALQAEKLRLEAENVRLRDAHAEGSARIDAETERSHTLSAENERLAAEAEQLRQLCEQAIADLRDERTRAREGIKSLEQHVQDLTQGQEEAQAMIEHWKREAEKSAESGQRDRLFSTRLQTEAEKHRQVIAEMEATLTGMEENLARTQTEVELERLRAVDVERQKWEEREKRLLRQLGELEQRVAQYEGRGTPLESRSIGEGEGGGVDGQRDEHEGERIEARVLPSPYNPFMEGTGSRTQIVEPLNLMSQAFLPQQIPPLKAFSGEARGEGEEIDDWLDRFQMIAEVYHWGPQAKLVNLATRLSGQAYAFYKSCTPQQRTSYDALVSALQRRFTPVRIQSVESSLFHERKQGKGESVDMYAQELRRLFHRAYPNARQGSSETEEMGRAVLASQFVSGLLPEVKRKVAGGEGDLPQLLAKARLEEAKLRDLAEGEPSKIGAQKPPVTFSQFPSRASQSAPKGGADKRKVAEQSKQGSVLRCYNCGQLGHVARECRQRGRGSVETKGRPKPPGGNTRESNIASIAAHGTASGGGEETHIQRTKVEELRHKLREAEVEEAFTEVKATLHGVRSSNAETGVSLGPSIFSEVLFEGVPVQALLDTGSPVTIVSLEWVLQALAKQRPQGQALEEWEKGVKARLEPPTVTLQSYGGNKLNIVSQIQCRISRGRLAEEVVVQVQRKAPVPLLIGTDIQPKLGFLFLQHGPGGVAVDLLQNKEVQLTEVNSVAKEAQDPSAKQTPTELVTSPSGEQLPMTVRLLHAVRLPAQHFRLVRAKVDGKPEEMTTLFEAEHTALESAGLVIEDGTIQPDDKGCVTLAVQNYGSEPVHWEEGEVLGHTYPATILPLIPEDDTDEEQGDAVEGQVHAIRPTEPADPQRVQQLLEILGVEQLDLSPSDKAQLSDLVEGFADVFALDETELGSTDWATHSIDTGDQHPVRQPPRRIPFALRARVEEMVQQMLKQEVIQPSQSPWSSPIVLVAKKDGSTRFCVDYRRLNSVTKLDVYPLPRIDDSLDLLAGSRYFSTLDLASGYWQVRMAEDSQEKTAFTTHSGLFEFRVMPFGLCNAPATFQRLMEAVLAGLARDVCVVYLDDILVMGKTFQEHVVNLSKVFARLREAGLRLKPIKCHLVQEEVEFLGHIVSAAGVAPDPRKIDAVRNFPTPTNLKTLRSFLGLASYYRRFVAQFSSIASPLFALTRKDAPFEWSPECQVAFQQLKQLLTEYPLLVFPDFANSFLLETDASGEGLGAVLAQRQEDQSVRPIAYASRTLLPHEKNYGISEMEALAVVWAVKHFRIYLYGHKCHVFTDHEALKSLLNTPHPSGKLARWGLALQELDLEIHYRPGKRNANADALSRAPLCSVPQQPYGIVAALSTPCSAEVSRESTLAQRQHIDPTLHPILEYLNSGNLPSDKNLAHEITLTQSHYTVLEGVLYRVHQDGTLRVIPPSRDRRPLFEEAHSGPFAGHLRDAKVYGELSRHYWWPKMRSDVFHWCRSCVVCATRRLGHKVTPPLVPIPVSGPFDRVGVDVIQFVKSHQGNRYAVVFVDYLTKWPEVFATKDQTALTIAHLLVEYVISRHGVPIELLSDRGPAFTSQLLKEVCDLMGIKKINTTAYHPQTDGLVERFNRTLTDMLAKTVEKGGRNWDMRLPYVLFAYRASPQESSRESPFFLLHGRDPRLPTEVALTPLSTRTDVDLIEYKTELRERMSGAWELARQSIKKAQKRQKVSYDRRAQDPTFRVGERVFLYTPSLKSGQAYKFARPFQGPFRIIELHANGATLQKVDRPSGPSIRVALSRLRRCPKEIPNESDSTVPIGVQSENDAPITDVMQEVPQPMVSSTAQRASKPDTPWTGRLRPRRGEDASP